MLLNAPGERRTNRFPRSKQKNQDRIPHERILMPRSLVSFNECTRRVRLPALGLRGTASDHNNNIVSEHSTSSQGDDDDDAEKRRNYDSQAPNEHKETKIPLVDGEREGKDEAAEEG